MLTFLVGGIHNCISTIKDVELIRIIKFVLIFGRTDLQNFESSMHDFCYVALAS